MWRTVAQGNVQRLCLWSVILVFSGLGIGVLHSIADAETTWPDSKASRHVRAFFAAVASGDTEQIKALVEHHYAPGATQDVDQEVVQHRSIHEQVGTLDVRRVDQPKPNELMVWAWSGKFGHWMKFVFMLEDQPPHRIVTALGNLSSAPTQPEIELAASMSLQEMARRAQIAMDAPGLAIAVFQRGMLIERLAIGVRAQGHTDSILTSDRFHLGSITKSMTATAIARLVENDTLSWSSQLGDIVPNLKMREVFRQVTLADLLWHRAGIVPLTLSSEYPAEAIVLAPTSLQEKRRAIATLALQRPPMVPPGTAMVYSNAGYVIASVMAETASGRTWEKLIQDHLFEPWGLNSCGFGWPATSQRRNQPHGHFGAPGHYRVQQPGEYKAPHSMRGAGDIHCSVTDLGRYGVLHLAGMRTGAPTLKAETVAWLHTPPQKQNKLLSYAAGWQIIKMANGARQDAHEGSSGTFFAHLSLFPESDLVVAVVANCGLHASSTVKKLVEAIEVKWRHGTAQLDVSPHTR